MRLLGRTWSNLHLLWIGPLALACLPILLLSLIVAGHFAGAILGPPAIWNRPRHTPPLELLVGHYIESRRTWDHNSTAPTASLDLRADGTMHVENLPQDSVTSTCILSGDGTWSGPRQDQSLDLNIISPSPSATCPAGGYAFLEITGRSAPYGLYWVLGDPDSGTGIWLQKRGPHT